MKVILSVLPVGPEIAAESATPAPMPQLEGRARI